MAEALPYRSRDGANAFGTDEGDNEDEDWDVDETGYKTVKDAILFAIDVSKSMLNKPPQSGSKKADTNSPLLAALKCAFHLMQQRIISNPKDMMGVLLYNTDVSKFYDENERSRSGWSFPHCYLLIDLDVPGAEKVKTLRSLVADDSDSGRAILKPASESISMHHVLFCANQIFQNKAPNFTSRRLFIVTDNDDPHASEKAFRTSAAVRAKDLYDLGVVIELFPISSSNHTFDTKLFYDDIVYRSNPSDPDAIAHNPAALTDTQPDSLKTGSADGLTLLQSLLSTIASKSTPKRTLFSSVPLELAPNLCISVKGYLLYKRQTPTRSSYIYLGSERPQIAVGITTQQSDESERKLEKFEIRKAYTFGGEQILFTPEETKQLRNFGDPVIRLIGFKPVSMLPLWANTKQSTFLYPSEDDYVGSTRVFSALHQKLLRSKLMAVTWFIARRNAAPVIAALIPTLPALKTDTNPNLTGVSATGCPQGLHLIPLPFADDIRQNPAMPGVPPTAPNTLIDTMSPIIRQLNLPKGMYDPSKYPNPSLQWFYRILQAMALDEDIPQKPEDKTLPRYRQIGKRVGVEMEEWRKELERSYEKYRADKPDAKPSGAKRVAANTENGGATKKLKTEPGQVVSEDDMRKLWQKGTMVTLTVAQLKDFCTMKKLSLAGKKVDLVERIEGWFESK